MARSSSIARVWRSAPPAFVPPALAFGGALAAAALAALAPGLGRWPYLLPWAALAGWAAGALHPLARHAPAPRRWRRAGAEPPAAVLLFRWPAGAALLGAAYYLAVGLLLGWEGPGGAPAVTPWERAYFAGLQGAAAGLLIWEVVLGDAARRARARTRRAAPHAPGA